MGNICDKDKPSKPVQNIKIKSIKRPERPRPLQQIPKQQAQKIQDLNKNINDLDLQKVFANTVKVKKKKIFEDFQIDAKIGQGGFAVVYLVQLKQNIQKGITQKYAMKKVPKEIILKKRLTQSAKLQKQILAKLSSSKFIVPLIYAFQDSRFVYFVMQCAVGGDTYQLIRKNSIKLNDYKSLGEGAVRFLAACVILGLQLLHKNNIMYRDLKPQNVLLFENGYAKLTDFGLAKKSIDDQTSKTISGTPFYYAPEMVLRLGYKKQIDLWALGVYLYQLSVLQPPFTTNQITKFKFKQAVLSAEKQRNWKTTNLSPQLKDLINGLLKFNPQKRIGAGGNWEVIKNHKFFADFNWDDLQEQKMESPLKDLVSKFPIQVKPYIAPNQKIVQDYNQINFQGFTYVRSQ